MAEGRRERMTFSSASLNLKRRSEVVVYTAMSWMLSVVEDSSLCDGRLGEGGVDGVSYGEDVSGVRR